MNNGFLAVSCPTTMVYQQCGCICPQTCDNIGGTCIGGCTEGCFCPAGLVIDDDGRCVEPATCPGMYVLNYSPLCFINYKKE